jgi:hypothetical protein
MFLRSKFDYDQHFPAMLHLFHTEIKSGDEIYL